MKILTRYLIRAHIGPFIFALTALTALVFLNAVAQRLELLAGKGLTYAVIIEFLLLSLPHTIALTLPMAVLVAVLYAFTELTAGSEITAMSAGGIKPVQLLMPIVGVSVLLAGGMYYFNDQVLPESNHRLKNLMSDLVRKSPTFELREQVVNEIRTGTGPALYFLQAGSIDQESSELLDVVIHDVSDPLRHRTIHAERGTMAFSEGRKDLFLTLFEGVSHEVTEDQPGSFHRMFFQKNIIPLRGVTDALDRQMGSGHRSDREMSSAMLREQIEAQEAQREQVVNRAVAQSREAVEQALAVIASGTGGADGEAGAVLDEAGVTIVPPSVAPSGIPESGRFIPRRSGTATRDEVTRQVRMSHQTAATQATNHRLNSYRYEVEIHKKSAIAFACIIFVLLGAPMAIRFPRGGVGMVIGASLVIFGIYWVGLLMGERLADRGRTDPFWSMWAPNILFMLVAAWLLAGMGKAGSTMRGGGAWEELTFRIRGWFTKSPAGGSGSRSIDPGAPVDAVETGASGA